MEIELGPLEVIIARLDSDQEMGYFAREER